MSLSKQTREAVQDWVGLLFSLSKAARELHDGIEIAFAEVVDIHETGGVESNVETMFGGSVTVRGLRVYAAAVQDFRDHCRADIRGLAGKLRCKLGAKLNIALTTRRFVIGLT